MLELKISTGIEGWGDYLQNRLGTEGLLQFGLIRRGGFLQLRQLDLVLSLGVLSAQQCVLAKSVLNWALSPWGSQPLC